MIRRNKPELKSQFQSKPANPQNQRTQLIEENESKAIRIRAKINWKINYSSNSLKFVYLCDQKKWKQTNNVWNSDNSIACRQLWQSPSKDQTIYQNAQ